MKILKKLLNKRSLWEALAVTFCALLAVFCVIKQATIPFNRSEEHTSELQSLA